MVHQKDWDQPRLVAWRESLEAVLEEVGEAYLVAHSLGCLLAASLAERPTAARVKAALLVAPCDLPPTEKLHPGQIVFGAMPTAELPFPSTIVGSLNDHYMSLDRLTLFARLWGSRLHNAGLAGHINVASGYGRWPGGYRVFETLKARTRHLGKIPPKRPALGRAASFA